jgi:NAD(P)-dependent dehydrogenase (short-subunit alcohol dehydrogenase family)
MKSNPFALKDQVIVITGASSGIGRQCAITCSQYGAVVIIMGRDRERLSATLELMENPHLHEMIVVDLCEFDLVANEISEICKRIGEISGLVNCAGISTTLPLKASSAEKMEFFFKTNVMGGLNLTKQIVHSSHFSKSGGSVVFISSVMGVVGTKGKTIYSMTKGALISATKSLAIELAAKKIRINSVSPGVVVTPMSKSAVYARNEEALRAIEDLHPLGLGCPEDVANACVFLLSEASRWITGSNLIVDGGYLAK